MSKHNSQFISVGIPTFECGPSLVKAIHSIHEQTYFSHVKEIILVVDGNTIKKEILQQIGHPLLKIILMKKQKGQSARLNDIFKIATGSLLVLTNDDVVLDRGALSAFADSFEKKQLDLISGLVSPLKSKKLWGSILEIGYDVNHEIIKKVALESYLSCNGRLIALSNDFYKKISIPETLWNNDAFLFFCAKAQGFSYGFAPNAKVYFQSPQNIQEHLRQSVKFQLSYKENQPFFEVDLKKYFKLSKKVILSSFLFVFRQKPMLTILYILLLLYSRITPKPKHTTGIWETDTTTKRISN